MHHKIGEQGTSGQSCILGFTMLSLNQGEIILLKDHEAGLGGKYTATISCSALSSQNLV